MDNIVWEKFYQFMTELRNEDVGQGIICGSDEYREAKREKSKKEKIYLEKLGTLSKTQQECITGYIEAIKDHADEECQKAYMQGFLDCIMVLCGSGVIKPRKNIYDIISGLK